MQVQWKPGRYSISLLYGLQCNIIQNLMDIRYIEPSIWRTTIMTLGCRDLIPYVTFRRRPYVVLALSCIPCFIMIYLTVVVSKTELTKSSNFMMNPHRNILKFRHTLNSSRTKKYASMDDLDKLEIKAKVNVSTVELPRCADLPSKPPKPEELRENFRWQTVDDRNDSGSYVFSAYYDDRTVPPMVRIIGIARELVGKKYCLLYFEVTSTPDIVEAELVLLPESHGMRYAAVFYICYIPMQRLQIPYAVSLVKSPCQASSNLLKILNNRRSHRYEVNFTVCITPINFHFNKVHQFIEILELNRLFGAEHFVFYNHTVGADVEKRLESYARDGIVSVIPWKIPVAVGAWPLDPALTPEIHYFGQVAAIHDCLYRNMLRSRFLVFTDLDEVIVPHEHATWSAMLSAATLLYQQDFFSSSGVTMFPGSYNVRNVFFRLDWEDVSAGLDLPAPLLTLQKRYREDNIYTWYVRSKHIVWSKMATMLAIHGAFEFVDDRKVSTVRVPETLALLHHYRAWDGHGTVPSGERIRDDRMLVFADRLISRVKAILLRNSS